MKDAHFHVRPGPCARNSLLSGQGRTSGHMTGQARAAELGLLSRWSDLVCPLAVDRGPSEPSLCCCPCFSVFLLLSMSRTCTASAGTGSAPESRSFPGKGEHHHPGRGAVRPVSVEQAAAVWLMRPEGGMEQKQFLFGSFLGLWTGSLRFLQVTAVSGEGSRPQHTPSSPWKSECSVNGED